MVLSTIQELPLAVLIDEFSASSSAKFLAGALHDERPGHDHRTPLVSGRLEPGRYSGRSPYPDGSGPQAHRRIATLPHGVARSKGLHQRRCAGYEEDHWKTATATSFFGRQHSLQRFSAQSCQRCQKWFTAEEASCPTCSYRSIRPT